MEEYYHHCGSEAGFGAGSEAGFWAGFETSYEEAGSEADSEVGFEAGWECCCQHLPQRCGHPCSCLQEETDCPSHHHLSCPSTVLSITY